jgi:Flp pilus assembly protein TadD
MPLTRARFIPFAAIAVLLLTVVYVPAGRLAVRESYGGAALPLDPGLHLRVPLYHRLFRYAAAPVQVDEGLEIATRDGATFRLPIAVSARISPGDLLTFHQGGAGREETVYIQERVREAVRDALRGLNADEILAGGVERRAAPAVSAALISLGIADDGLTIGTASPQVVFNAVADDLHRKFPASARRLAEAALARAPREALHHAAMGLVLEAEKKPREAEREYLEALYLDPACLEPMSRIFVLYQSSGDPETILRLQRLLEASLEKKKDSPLHHDWLGQVYLRLGKNDRAEMAFQTAVAQAPNEPELRVNLGGLKARQGKLDEARAAFEEALRLRPEHPLALFNMGSTYAVEGNLDKAIEYLQRAERAGPPNHGLLNALAQAYEQKNQLDRAAEYLRRSLALKPGQPDRQAALKRIESQLRKKRSLSGLRGARRGGDGAS